VQALAQRKNASTNRVIVDLIESGLNAQEQDEEAFFRARRSADAVSERSRAETPQGELARMTFGE